MFIHAVTGCDTTSRIFGIGKKTAFQKFVKGDPVLQSFANAFTVPNQTPEVIDDLGSQVMAVLFGGKCTDSLATMRYNIFSKRVVSASSPVTPERLPPTESATKLHCRRAYYQIMVWMGKEGGIGARRFRGPGMGPRSTSHREVLASVRKAARLPRSANMKGPAHPVSRSVFPLPVTRPGG
ncbi:hypothetical protein SKAU_G00271670 [Synaphobranchus kaupii]|uniref:Uncharacterized protein n=1 Tax=Synaphobranchus kaupii TaxID=118154 RepID=A0A9Q1F0H4_SYNKA|nr:hypothetical protein SKAU_G00271670 [Synaphobranchus kaupii]